MNSIYPFWGVFFFVIFFAVTPTAIRAFPQESVSAAASSDSGAALFLELIRMEGDRTKRQGLMEQFTARYPKHEYTSTALNFLQTSYLREEKFDQSIRAGERLLEMNSSDMNAATLCHQAAEGKKDPALVKKWADRITAIERKPAGDAKPASPAPKGTRKPGSPS